MTAQPSTRYATRHETARAQLFQFCDNNNLHLRGEHHTVKPGGKFESSMPEAWVWHVESGYKQDGTPSGIPLTEFRELLAAIYYDRRIQLVFTGNDTLGLDVIVSAYSLWSQD